MTKILVTGSRGFVGTQVVKHLNRSEIVTDSSNSKRTDLRNINEVLKIDSADIVIHLGGKYHQKN